MDTINYLPFQVAFADGFAADCAEDVLGAVKSFSNEDLQLLISWFTRDAEYALEDQMN